MVSVFSNTFYKFAMRLNRYKYKILKLISKKV